MPQAGSYDVSLTVTSLDDESTLAVTDYLTVHAEPLANAGTDLAICSSENASLEATASSYSSILWTSDGDGTFANNYALSTTYTPGTNDLLNGTVTLSFTAYPLTPCSVAASDQLIITILTAPEITGQPEDITVVEGETATFTISASGSAPLAYQWFGPSGEISGATAEQLVIDNAGSEDAGAYYCSVTNSCGSASSETAILSIDEYKQQIIQIPDGWSGFSTCIMPDDPLTANMFAGITADNGLVVLQNYSFMYWPGAGINTIDLNGGLDPHSGYQLKVNGDQQITVSGQAYADKNLSYAQAGWQLLPVLSECNVSTDQLFSEISDELIILKEIAGMGIYWPGVFQNLYQLVPGKAYAVKFAGPVNLTFPDCETMKAGPASTPVKDMGLISSKAPASPLSHTIVLSAELSSKLHAGDILIISSETQEKARITIQNPGMATGLQVFGDDPLTAAKEGFGEGETIRIQLLANDQISEIYPDYDTEYDALSWKNNGMTLLKSLMQSQGTGDQLIPDLTEFYPNPTRDMLFLSDNYPYSSIIIYTHQGKKVIEKQGSISEIDVSSLSMGLYFIHIQSEEETLIRKFVKH